MYLFIDICTGLKIWARAGGIFDCIARTAATVLNESGHVCFLRDNSVHACSPSRRSLDSEEKEKVKINSQA